MKEASSFLTDKEVIFERSQIIKTAVRISGGEHSISEFEAGLKDKTLSPFPGQEPTRPQAGKELFTTREMLKLEARKRRRPAGAPPFHCYKKPAPTALLGLFYQTTFTYSSDRNPRNSLS